MHEDVLIAVIRRDEPIAANLVKPQNFSRSHREYPTNSQSLPQPVTPLAGAAHSLQGIHRTGSSSRPGRQQAVPAAP
ncbi:hypothetical protein AAHZ94_33215, partial [Streptomyces sp. HSW2009]|uniref:hypothetical protein n=1 Tax=Streptomyces sp. HSW2009 TaxID=3142890 RepID=UPI0032EC2190